MNTNTNTNRRNERGLFGIAQQAYYEEALSKNSNTTKVLAAMPRIGWSADVQDEIDRHLSRTDAPERNYISLCTDIDMDSYHSHRRSSSVKHYLPRNERRSSSTTAPRGKSLSPKGMRVEIQRRRKSLSPTKGTKIEAERSSHNRRKPEKAKEKSPERALRRAGTTPERKPRERRRPSVSAKRDKAHSRLHRSHPELSQTRGKSQEEPSRRSASLHRSRRERRHQGTPHDEPSRRSAATESSSHSSRRHAGSKHRSNHSAEGGTHNRFPRRTRSKSMTHIDLIDQDNNNHKHGSKARSKLSSKSARSLSPSSNKGFPRTTRPAPRSKPGHTGPAHSPTSPKEVCRLQWQPSFDSIDTWTAEDLVGAPSEPLLPAFPDSSDDRSGRSHSKR